MRNSAMKEGIKKDKHIAYCPHMESVRGMCVECLYRCWMEAWNEGGRLMAEIIAKGTSKDKHSVSVELFYNKAEESFRDRFGREDFIQ